jgi:hypothetical protein
VKPVAGVVVVNAAVAGVAPDRTMNVWIQIGETEHVSFNDANFSFRSMDAPHL